MSPNLLPRLYAHHPSRPISPCSLSTFDSNTRAGPYIGVIVFIPSPVDAEAEQKLDMLQQLRERWDQAYPRWLPHVTLVPPFVVPKREQPPETGLNGKINTLQSMEERGERIEEHRDADDSAWDYRAKTYDPGADLSPSRKGETVHPVITARDVSSALESLCETLVRVCAEIPDFTLNLNDVGTFKLREYTNVHLRPQFRPPKEAEFPLATLHSRLVGSLPAYVTRPEGKRKPLDHLPTQRQNNSRRMQQHFSPDNAPETRMNRSERRRRAREKEGEVSPLKQAGNQMAEQIDADPVHVQSPQSGGEHPASDHPHLARPAIPAVTVMKGSGDTARQHDSVTTTSEDNQPTRRASSPGPAIVSHIREQKQLGNNGGRRKFQPHVSVGQARGWSQLRTLERLTKELISSKAEGGERGLDGIECLVDKVYLLTKPQGKTGPYEVFKVVPLAHPQAVKGEQCEATSIIDAPHEAAT